LIGQISGILVAKQAPEIHLEVAGITYEIQVPMSTLYQLPEIGQKLILHTHFVVREDAQLLYGFYDAKDKAMFRALIRVNGVGPKLGLAILSGMEADDFARTVRDNDVTTLVGMPGIGKKTAERLIVEMRDRLSEWEVSGIAADGSGDRISTSAVTKDAETALVSLGYKPMQAARAIALVVKDNTAIANSEELIRLALKSMV
jgi:Holliday junction DNA helicase RuvA